MLTRRRSHNPKWPPPYGNLAPWRRLVERFLLPGVLAFGLVVFNAWCSVPMQNNSVLPPLSTQGERIVDAQNQPVLLRGVNWFGIETETQAPHGLWARDYKDMLSQIRQQGYNVIRLPYSVQGLRSDRTNSINFSIGSNRELEGKTPLKVMDAIIQEAGRQGLMILLDSHRLNNQRIPELWYGDGFTEEDWINTWTMLAERYRDQPNVIGADLKNEPHGAASWGTGDRATDWRLAAERAGNAILQVNPNWLIVVEGVERNVPGQRLSAHWWGGNLEGVRDNPVRLSVNNKLVYSPHEYGPGVINQAWFSESTFPQNLIERWETGFNYIARQGIAPVLIGEFGGRQVDERSPEGVWQRQLVTYIQQNNLHFTYWSWNPNSSDTGGILLDDWQTIDAPKQNLLNQLLPVSGYSGSSSPSPTPSTSPTPPTPSPSPSPTINPGSSPDMSLQVITQIQSDWETGFCVAFQVRNSGTTPVNNWHLRFQMNQATINNSWNGTFNRQGSDYTVEAPDWGRTLERDRSVDMGFCANKTGSDYQPRQVRVELM
ncbi:cellulase family glycosylhydrolase [Leptolyngbya sp. FACHB-16]|nr:cellulase family glycosylhydrolase [Leptolyngbya sp. FACHB-8]MBD2158829.1 cellulase family glycosylhydrolase [Leptolyngbya sp. FACHB-16]